METTKHHGAFGLLGQVASIGPRAGVAPYRRGKRNRWVVAGFFALVIAAWINSQM